MQEDNICIRFLGPRQVEELQDLPGGSLGVQTEVLVPHHQQAARMLRPS